MPPRPLPSALSPFLDLLRCPRCGQRVDEADGSLRCPSRHTYDVARGGYASLLTGVSPTSGDDDEMARARDRFLGSGAYAPILETIAAAVGMAGCAPDPTMLDVGCGTGYYLAGVLDALPGARGLGLDTSTRALRFAARAHERAAAASWDVFAPFPLTDGSVDVMLDVFAPRNPEQFARVLRPDGVLVVVRPTARHLAELLAQVPGSIGVDPAKEERLHRALDPFFDEVREDLVEYVVDLDGAQAQDLIAMTPSARHTDLSRGTDSTVSTTVSVLVSGYRRRA
ncbi:methyltransferase domain-containing protein [Brachybacterium muris]|uniref:methyltransferase n=1 Tax=Brachybacterium muris TaxID=219301 RepID=UPI0021A51257|nr:methyltransferase domain-containing protein [Brachybacterium muris]